MSDIKLFRYGNAEVQELEGKSASLERDLQALIEDQMVTFLGVRFLASEYATSKNHRGRIDSLGLDENGCPVIIEYKRHTNENVINQGLFYLDWLLDHQGEFELLVMKQLGAELAKGIEWNGIRLLCIAEDFTRYDVHAVQQINRNIELIRYKLFDADLLMLELVNAVSADAQTQTSGKDKPTTTKPAQGTFHKERFAAASSELRVLFEAMQDFAASLGDEVQVKPLVEYVAFRRLKNFVTATVIPKQDPQVKMWLRLDPDSVELDGGFAKDMRDIGHWGTGDLQLCLRTPADLEKAKPLIVRSYQEN